MGVKNSLKSIANNQRGYFSTQQAISAGYISQNHSYHVKTGNWEKIDRGIYKLPGYENTLESNFVRWSLWALGYSKNRIIVVSHESALNYYGLMDSTSSKVHLSVCAGRFTKMEPQECSFHFQYLNRREYSIARGYNITTPFRTLYDMKPELIIKGVWLKTVALAFEKMLLDKRHAKDMLGERQYNKMIEIVDRNPDI